MDLPTALEVEAAKVFVAAMANGLVELVKKIPSLFRRQGQAKVETVTKEAEAATRELAAANDADRDRLQIRHEAAWELRIRDLLAEHPDAAADLDALKVEIETALKNNTSGATTYIQHIGNRSAGAQGPGASATTINLT